MNTDYGSSSTGRVVAVTGATGYLGSRLADAFAQRGDKVVRLVRRPRPDTADRWFDLAGTVDPEVLDGVDTLIHAAHDLTATHRDDIWATNVFGSRSLLELAARRGVPRTVVLSSMSAYPGTHQLYGRSKLEIERSAFDLGMRVVRPGLVYGTSSGGMAGTLHRLASLPVLPDLGPRAHQFLVEEHDFVSALLAVADAPEMPSVPIGIAHPDPVSFRKLLETFAAAAGRRSTRFVPVPPMALYWALRAAELTRVPLPVRADSLLGLVKPASEVPNIDILSQLGVLAGPFAR